MPIQQYTTTTNFSHVLLITLALRGHYQQAMTHAALQQQQAPDLIALEQKHRQYLQASQAFAQYTIQAKRLLWLQRN